MKPPSFEQFKEEIDRRHGEDMTTLANSVADELADEILAEQKELVNLRDWFAGMAMNIISDRPFPPERIASEAYKMADAMMEARDEKMLAKLKEYGRFESAKEKPDEK